FGVAAVEQGHFYIHDREAGKNAQFHRTLNALVDRLDVFPGYHAAFDRVDELIALAWLVGLDPKPAMAVIARTTGLPDVLTLGFGCLAQGLAESHFWLAHIGLDLMLPLHAVYENFKVQLAHAANNGLARIFVGTHFKGGILIGQPRKRQ